MNDTVVLNHLLPSYFWRARLHHINLSPLIWASQEEACSVHVLGRHTCLHIRWRYTFQSYWNVSADRWCGRDKHRLMITGKFKRKSSDVLNQSHFVNYWTHSAETAQKILWTIFLCRRTSTFLLSVKLHMGHLVLFKCTSMCCFSDERCL